MKSGLAVLLVLAALVALCTAQTFQYSRGWTNGKRAIGAIDVDAKLESTRMSSKDLFTLVELNRRMCMFLSGGSHEDQ
ncbi:pro-corazonin-like [Tropilaelaps mercedesae]|uniref:Pro-corazonin n=1 Tax=Tropilaelaps mercedesae TaxID=418985 RepID=A0A1V9Y2S7_9ACAR|nr:pro-corazonin-like [Tropilaelaps mercedesae]